MAWLPDDGCVVRAFGWTVGAAGPLLDPGEGDDDDDDDDDDVSSSRVELHEQEASVEESDVAGVDRV